ncbi:MAG TPA: glycosyltransferase family 2 protein [Candidatus Jeotgalibaca pullicola]|nr:glycosyltransferase family 2 protein [Candidatus Jeotgalibaca pullicola]
MHQCVVIIPAYNPEPTLIQYVEELVEKGVQNVIIINDGSESASLSLFESLDQMESCTVLTHGNNQGKGRALKTAFQYVRDRKATMKYLVMADADGQHAVDDVLQLLKVSKERKSGIILGVRDFDQAHVPSKNAFGNKLTSKAFKIFFGKYLSDTQTGLRSFSISELDWLLVLKGERFEYEMNMLIYAIYKSIPIYEQPIQTIYFGEKTVSHYKAFHDSIRIAKLMFRGFVMKNSLVD